MESWATRRGMLPEMIPERECEQLLEILAQMPVLQLCEIIESDLVAFTPKSLMVEWSKQRSSKKPSMSEQLQQYLRQQKSKGE